MEVGRGATINRAIIKICRTPVLISPATKARRVFAPLLPFLLANRATTESQPLSFVTPARLLAPFHPRQFPTLCRVD